MIMAPLFGEFAGTLQVNLFRKLSFLNQLTHNVTRDCSLNSPKNTSSQHVLRKNCFEYQNKKTNNSCTHHVVNLYFSGNSMNNLLDIFVILWVNWCKNEGLWKRFTCTGTILATSGDDGQVRLWKANYMDDWKCVAVLRGDGQGGHSIPMTPSIFSQQPKFLAQWFL